MTVNSNNNGILPAELGEKLANADECLQAQRERIRARRQRRHSARMFADKTSQPIGQRINAAIHRLRKWWQR
ncbi:hypothetical protein IM880_13030 [Pectobacterium polaris]|uniref:PerC family transcriptional regulator n=1 Tax=Pectobacterium polaris TaxID=2042057 RepID=A0AAW4P1D2_9GAMM|nr:hypothetical protein [Pectobacterium polaris]MBW5893139.1 hypothetical protein [Pectobacterium polaris]